MIDLAVRGPESERGSAIFTLLLVTLAWLPVPLGSNRTWSLALMCALTTTLLGVFILRDTIRFSSSLSILHTLRLPLLCLTIWILITLVQLFPIPVERIDVLGGAAHQSYLALSELTPTETAYLTLDPGSTLNGLLFQCSLLAIFVLVLMLGTSYRRVIMLMWTIFAIGFIQALYAIVALFTSETGDPLASVDISRTVTGTYVNPNHFAGLLELAIPTGIALLLTHQREPISFVTPKVLARGMITYVLDGRGLIMFCLLVMGGALLLTASRGAIISLCAGIGIGIVAALITRGRKARELSTVIALAAVLLGGSLWFGAAGLSQKLGESGLRSNRPDLREISYQIVADHPLGGTGFGTFRWVFPMYRDHRFGNGFYEHAHNDYLEIAIEQGISGLLIFATAVTALLIHLFLALRNIQESIGRAAIFAGISGASALLVHGLVDFNLRIPANAGLFFALLATACCAVTLATGRRTGEPAGNGQRAPTRSS